MVVWYSGSTFAPDWAVFLNSKITGWGVIIMGINNFLHIISAGEYNFNRLPVEYLI